MSKLNKNGCMSKLNKNGCMSKLNINGSISKLNINGSISKLNINGVRSKLNINGLAVISECAPRGLKISFLKPKAKKSFQRSRGTFTYYLYCDVL